MYLYKNTGWTDWTNDNKQIASEEAYTQLFASFLLSLVDDCILKDFKNQQWFENGFDLKDRGDLKDGNDLKAPH